MTRQAMQDAVGLAHHAGGHLPKRPESATFPVSAVSFLCLACGWAQMSVYENQQHTRGGSLSTKAIGRHRN